MWREWKYYNIRFTFFRRKVVWKRSYNCRHFILASVLNNNIIIRENIGSRENLLLLQERYFMVPMRLSLVRWDMYIFEQMEKGKIYICNALNTSGQITSKCRSRTLGRRRSVKAGKGCKLIKFHVSFILYSFFICNHLSLAGLKCTS